MAITINSKFVKFNYVKYRTVEGKDSPQPYVREDIAEILDAIVNYGAIAFISGYDNTLPWPDGNATEDATDHKATTAEVAKGYVEVVATGGCYLYNVKVVQVSAIQEKPLYSTDFTNWKEIDRSKATNEVVNVKTLYSKEELSFTFNGVGVYPKGTNSKFSDIIGFMQTAKYTGEYKAAEPSVVTSALGLHSITKLITASTALVSKKFFFGS